jgi:hypothetical protein
MDLLELNSLDSIKRDDYVILRFRGLFGDILHGMSRIQPVLNKYPKDPWIILHEYPYTDKMLEAMNLFKYWIDNERIKYYFHIPQQKGFKISADLVERLRQLGIQEKKIFDFDIFQYYNTPLGKVTLPNIGIEIPETTPKKAVIHRYSGYHRHFLKRNRPINEWTTIEQCLLKNGYTVYLLGIDDTMENPNDLIDLRGKLNVKEVLEFTADAELCVCVTTFLYLWQQFICPTMILSETGDLKDLNERWKLSDKLEIVDVLKPTYLNTIVNFIGKNSGNKIELPLPALPLPALPLPTIPIKTTPIIPSITPNSNLNQKIPYWAKVKAR